VVTLRAPRSFIWLLALATVVSTVSLAGAPSVRATSDAPVQIVLDRLTPVVPEPGDNLRVEGRIVNNTSTAITGTAVRVRISREPLTRRSQITKVREAELDTEDPRDPDTEPFAEPVDEVVDATRSAVTDSLPPRGQASFALRIPFEELPLVEQGVYALAVEVLGVQGGSNGQEFEQRQGIKRTFLPWFPDPQAITPVQMVWLWPLADYPARTADGVFLDDQTPEAIAPGGRLDALVRSGSLQPRSLTWIADPAVVQSVQDMTDGYRVERSGEVVVGDRSDDARAWLEGLEEVLADATAPATESPALRVLPYADVDATALTRADMSTDVVRSITQAVPVASAALGQPVTGGLYWAPFGRVDRPTADLLASAGVRTVIVSGRFLRAQDAFAGANTGRAVISTSFGALQAVLREPRMSDLLTAPQRNRSDAIEVRQAFLAESGVLAGTIPQDAPSRAIVVGPDDIRWEPSTTVVNALLRATLTAPWMTPLSLDELLSGPTNPLQRKRGGYGRKARAAELSTDYLTQVRRASDELAAFTSVLDNPIGISDVYAAALLRSASSAWRAEPERGLELLQDTRGQLTAQVDQVQVLSEGTVTFSGDNGRVPVTIENNLDRAVTVGVELRASPSLRLESEPLDGINIEPGRKVSVDLQARVVGGNTLPVRVQLLTPDGSRFGSPARIDVASTAYARAAAWVVAIAFVAIVVFVVFGVIRRIRIVGSTTRPGVDDE
jgi:hypothetical protein